MKKLALVSMFLLAITMIATALPSNSEAFLIWTPGGHGARGGGCGWDSSALYGWGGYSGGYGYGGGYSGYRGYSSYGGYDGVPQFTDQ